MKGKVEIQNLKCGGCEATILKKLGAEKGVHQVSVDMDHHTVLLDYDTSETLKRVQKALAKMGYPIIGDSNGFGKKARSYMSCAAGKFSKAANE